MLLRASVEQPAQESKVQNRERFYERAVKKKVLLSRRKISTASQLTDPKIFNAQYYASCGPFLADFCLSLI